MPARVLYHDAVSQHRCVLRADARDRRRFAAELALERLVFKAVNYDRPENAHFSRDYKLPCPSLVLVRQKGGKDQEWKLLGQIWDFVQIPPRLDQYIEEETRKFLEAVK